MHTNISRVQLGFLSETLSKKFKCPHGYFVVSQYIIPIPLNFFPANNSNKI